MPTTKPTKQAKQKIEGEGSYEAGRRYDAEVRTFVRKGGVEPAARDAEAALDGPEAAGLAEAERAGRAGKPATPGTRDDAAPRHASTEATLVDLERQYWQAMKDKDVDAALRMTDDPVVVAGAQGIGQVGRVAFAKLMTGATWILHDFEMLETKVQMVRDDVAIVAYRVHEELTVDGQRLSVDAADASTWVRRDGRWLCALHTESLAGDPYGRDRHPRAK